MKQEYNSLAKTKVILRSIKVNSSRKILYHISSFNQGESTKKTFKKLNSTGNI